MIRRSRVDSWQAVALGVAVALSAGGATFGGRFREAASLGRFRACLANVTNISTALERYSTDHEGRYPKSLKELIPSYLSEFPQCPSAGRDTYSGSAQLGPSAPTNPNGSENFYYLSCAGANHWDARADTPWVSNGYPSCLFRSEADLLHYRGYRGSVTIHE